MKKVQCPRCDAVALFGGEKPWCPDCGWNREAAEQHLRERARIGAKTVALLLGPPLILGLMAWSWEIAVFFFFVLSVVISIHVFNARRSLKRFLGVEVKWDKQEAMAERPLLEFPPPGQRVVRGPRRWFDDYIEVLIAAAVLTVVGFLAATEPAVRDLLGWYLGAVGTAVVVVTVSLFAYVLARRRERRRELWLLTYGLAAVGRVTQERLRGGRSRQHLIHFEFPDASGRLVQGQTVDRTESLYEEMQVWVFYEPSNTSNHIALCETSYELESEPGRPRMAFHPLPSRPAPSLSLLAAAPVAVLFLISGLAMGEHAARNLRLASQSRNWPTVDGVIVKAASEPAGKSRYRVELVYQYTVQDRLYKSHRLNFDSRRLSKAEARMVIKRYKPGTRVKISYDPKQPALAVLEPGVPPGAYGQLMFAAFLCAAPLLAFGSIIFQFLKKRT